VLVAVFAAGALAAEGGALSRTAERNATQNQAAANLGGGNTGTGRGADLRAIASPRKTPQTLTGFPAGTLPGDSGGSAAGAGAPQEGRVVQAGEPLNPIIDQGMVGTKLDQICAVVDHAGYWVVRGRYSSAVLDSAYTFFLMNGRRRISTLYFDRGMKLVAVQ
jgi:hypothetical protein